MGLRTYTNKFNRGEVDPKAIARQDVERIRNSGAYMENWMPVRLGPMQYRPGFEFIGRSDTFLGSYFLPFVASTNDTALLEITSLGSNNGQLRVWRDDAVITRVQTLAAITNGGFGSSIAGWNDVSTGSGFAIWATLLQAANIVGDGVNPGALRQMVTLVTSGVEHALRFRILFYPIVVKIGTAAGLGDIFEGEMKPGWHSLAFTPTTNFYVEFSNTRFNTACFDSVSIEGTGDLTLPIIVPESLLSIRYAQSADVMFLAGDGIIQQRIERRGPRSWSVVQYQSDDGPFEAINTTPITLTSSAVRGSVNITASAPFFKPGHEGALFKLITTGQSATVTAAGDNVFSNSIRVFGSGTVRTFAITIAEIVPPLVATITLQRSLDNTTWQDYATFSAPVVTTSNDGLDNQLVYYRIGVKTGDYTSGALTASLTYGNGSTSGLVRIDRYSSSQFVLASVIKDLGSTTATRDWYEGSWSGVRGYPSAVALFEGRLWWAGKNKLWGSVSDVYDSFDRDIEGASSSIERTIGFGPVDRVEWLFPTSRLIMGLASNDVTVRSNSFGEILTSLNTNLRKGSTQGAAPRDVCEVDDRLYFVQRSLRKIFEVEYSSDSDSYPSIDMNVLTPSLFGSDIVRIAVTRQPETRIWVVLADGTMCVYLREKAEDVAGWCRVTVPFATILDVVSLPGTPEDLLYIVVDSTKMDYPALLKLSRFDQSIGGFTSKHLDYSLTLSSPGLTFPVAHLKNGTVVRVWGSGEDRGEFTVTGGNITVPTNWSSMVVGVPYTAAYRSNKLTDYMDGWVLNQNKRITRLGMVLQDVWPGSLKYGSDADHLDPMPLIENGTTYASNATQSTYDELPFEFNGTYDSDSRYYLQATGPCTVLAVTIEVDDPNYTPQ